MCHCKHVEELELPGNYLRLDEIHEAGIRIQSHVLRTPFELNARLSRRYNSNVFLKREDQQEIRSFKVRGALNKLLSLSTEQKSRGVVCASAGNHAQGVAYACHKLKVKGDVFLPLKTPAQKVSQVRFFGGEWVRIVLVGEAFDDTCIQAVKFQTEHDKIFVHPFDDRTVMAGQGSLALEMIADVKEQIDYLLIPVGGGGLASGVATVFNQLSPKTKLIGVEVCGAEAMWLSLKEQKRAVISDLSAFADGTAVQ